jgi:hypothetical protein
MVGVFCQALYRQVFTQKPLDSTFVKVSLYKKFPVFQQ